MEDTGLPTIHPWKGDAMHNQDRIQSHLEPQKISFNHNHDNTIGFCIKEEPGLTTIHPLEQDAEAIPEASQIQAQVSATIVEQLQKEPLISHMDCLSQTEGSNHGNLHNCSICNREFSCLKDLQWHLCKKTYTCEICNAEFIADFLLQKHMEKHNNQKFFLCGICKAPFDSKVERGKHANVVHGKKFQCKKCSKDFPNKYSRKRHMLIHTGQIFFCKLCDYNFATKHSLERHNAEKHSALAKKTFVCEICHESFFI
ncbi:KRAB [Mytilus coruscus]|uniref:KRAB n=1 Tax=Mytilus coruscus TaxID=42192 RepID=A0A6J8BPK8_MYTCO|nr:KRAB [Mytilus coruscus]